MTLFLNNSQEIITRLVSSIRLQNQLTEKVKHQQYLQETVITNAMKLKQLARTNIDKTQDILTNVIQAARHEYDLLKQVKDLLHLSLYEHSPSIRSVLFHKRSKQSYELLVLIHFGFTFSPCVLFISSPFLNELVALGDEIIPGKASLYHRFRLDLFYFVQCLFMSLSNGIIRCLQ